MLSEKDIKILDLMKRNCKMSTREISNKTGIPITTIHNRIKKLEGDKVIKGYRAVIDNKKIGRGVQAFVEIGLEYGPGFSQEEFAKNLFKMPEVDECYIMTGATDIIIKVSTSDVDQLNDIIIHRLRGTKGIKKTTTAIILQDIGESIRMLPKK